MLGKRPRTENEADLKNGETGKMTEVPMTASDWKKKFFATELSLNEHKRENARLKSQRKNLKKKLKDLPNLLKENKKLGAENKKIGAKLAKVKALSTKLKDDNEVLKSKLNQTKLESFKQANRNSRKWNPKQKKRMAAKKLTSDILGIF